MFHHTSYDRHATGFAADFVDPARKRIAATWFDQTTADAWRHNRGYEIANYLGGNPNDRWITIGDGRFGLDAIRLKQHGVAQVLATDIDGTLLKAAKDQGHLDHYSVENAELLSFGDASFDYSFCKEAYHHFPRPAVALYEMLRVARKGIILVEPNDRINSPARVVAAVIRRLLGKPAKHPDSNSYEEDGNYVYSISRREIEKIALGINLPQVAFKGLNDYYVPGLEYEVADMKRSAMYRKMRRIIAFRDVLCCLRIDRPTYMMACLFHEPVSVTQRSALRRNGWTVIDLPRNPYADPRN